VESSKAFVLLEEVDIFCGFDDHEVDIERSVTNEENQHDPSKGFRDVYFLLTHFVLT
jgi:hypothetical protein